MDTSEYLSMFLEESMDNLQILNDSLLQLEQEPEDIDKLNEIFRVAHTIKGMAATMGFTAIAELTHNMEDVLSEFRSGELKVTQEVITLLFTCLDTLEYMVDNISEGIDEEVPIDDIIENLHSLSGKKLNLDEHISIKNIENIDEKAIKLNEYDIYIIQEAFKKGYDAFEIKITLDSNTLLKSARSFLIFNTLEDFGEIIKSVPCVEDIETENFEYEIILIYLSTNPKGKIYKEIMNVSEVDNVSINKVNLAEETNTQDYSKVKNKEDLKQKQSEKTNNTKRKKGHQSVRVDLERLDKFMNMVSELVIHRTRLEQISNTYKVPDLNETLEQVGRTTSDLQDLVMKIRMLPLDSVFSRFPRLVRDLSVELEKDMELIIRGQDTELDRTVIDEIGDPLVHLIRNAADHGIESKEDRIKNGKDPVGKIKLIAYQEGTKAVIKVEDDGAGINLDKVKDKAESIGINTEGMLDEDIKNLIFAEGFSTNKEVTDVSGRGVGMDVVKTKISSLGGTVEVVSEVGKGSSFIIKLPLTLQIIQALLVKVGSETMAISLGYVERVIDYDENKIKKTNNKEVIIYNENVIPLIRLNKKLGLENLKEDKYYIVIVRVGEDTVGLLVDALLGQREIVIKPLGKTLKSLNEYIGATILGDGLVTLILDISALI